MFGNKELEARVEYLEKEVASLRRERELIWEVVNAKYKNVEKIIERYVQEHIWYTNVENLQAFEKGSEVRVVLKELDSILGHDTPESKADTARYALGKKKKTVKGKTKKTEVE